MVLFLGTTHVAQILCRISNYLHVLQTVGQAVLLLKPKQQALLLLNTHNKQYLLKPRQQVLQLLISQWWVMQLNQRTNPCLYQLPLYIQRDGHEKQFVYCRRTKQGHHEGKTRGRKRGSYLIWVFKWAVWCAKRFQLLFGTSALLPGCWDGGIVGPVAWNKRLRKSSSWITF